ncbi:unnamed protein product, partial [marine sediment metagenome]
TTVTMDSDKTVTAIFQAVAAADEAVTYTLTTAVDPADSGSVTGGGTYDLGETANVEAIPATCYEFDHWSGDLTGSTNPTTILMDGDKSVTAHFKKITYTLATAVDPTDSGSVTGAETYDCGETVNVEAIPARCYEFDHWSGDLTGSTNPTTILMDGDKSVTAHFKKITYKLTTYADPDFRGYVTGGGTYDCGETALVKAHPYEGSKFDHWSGDLSGSTNPTTILMDGNKSVTAHFKKTVYYYLNTKVSPYNKGSV